MDLRLRHQRNGYWLFLGLIALALLSPIPLLNAQSSRPASAKPATPAPAVVTVDPQRPDFDKADRNRDGFVDKSEAGSVQGLSANFERVDRNRDGKLDREEFARALTFLVGHR